MNGDPIPSSSITDATVGGLSVIVITGGSTGQVLTLQANGTYAPATVSAGIGGTVGTITNRIPKSSGTGGSTLQASGLTVDSSDNLSGVALLTATQVTTTGGNPGFRVDASGAAKMLIGYSVGKRILIASDCTIEYENGTSVTDTPNIKLVRASAGLFQVQCDNGLAIKNLAGSSDAALTAAAITASGLLCCGVYTFATVPSASSNTGKFLRISDRAQKHAYSDGTNWRFFNDDAVIS